MNCTTGAVFSLILAAGFAGSSIAMAGESACVKSFRKANSEFFRTHADLERKRSEAKMEAILVGGVVGTGCMILRRSVMGVVGCGALGGILGGGSYAYSESQAAKLQRLYDAHRLYQTYYASLTGDIEQSEYAKEFLADLGVDVQKEKAALKELAALIEWGSLCEGEQPRSYEEALGFMKARLHAPN